MINVTLKRLETGPDGTFGELTIGSSFKIMSGELPWRNNLQGRSCIPEGSYVCTWKLSPKHGLCYHVENVPSRTDVEIHVGNFCGDTDQNRKSDVAGCILPGIDVQDFTLKRLDDTTYRQRGVAASRQALEILENALNREPFNLIVKWPDEIAISE